MNPKPGLYRHYKGKYYFLFQIAHHSETREAMAVYQCLYDDFSWWVRPLDMFMETIEIDKRIQPRFAFEKEMTLEQAKNFKGINN